MKGVFTLAKMIISEELFDCINDTLGKIKLEFMRKENSHLKELTETVSQLENVCNFISLKRSLNRRIDHAIAGYNQPLVNQLIDIKKQAEMQLTEKERALL